MYFTTFLDYFCRRLLATKAGLRSLGLLMVAVVVSNPVQAQIGKSQRIGGADAQFGGGFGMSVARVGDLNGDGNAEMAIGALEDDDGGAERGAVWIVFPNDDGTVAAKQKISDTTGGFEGILNDGELFGNSVARAGDLNEDGVPDLAVGAPGDDDERRNAGAVWILFLNSDGTVAGHQKISNTAGNFTGLLNSRDNFGESVALVGDFNQDGVPDLAVGASRDDDGGRSRGAVWILFLTNDGTVSTHQKISSTAGGFGGFGSTLLDDGDFFGSSIAPVGDLNGDQVPDLAVGATLDDALTDDNRGAVWILFMRTDGTVAAESKINGVEGGFGGSLDNFDVFAASLARVGDLDGNGVPDLAVGAFRDDDGGTDRGAVWMLYLNSDGTVASETKISDTRGGLDVMLGDDDGFGTGVSPIGDLDDDGIPDLVVGALNHRDFLGDSNIGAAWILFGEQALLPVDLTSFEATRNGENAVRLTWRTASERNNAGFEVQRKADAKKTSWTKVGFVESKVQGGTTTEAQTYRFVDADLPYAADTLTYRLRQLDTDGTESTSKGISVHRIVDEVQLLGTYPNPASQWVTLRFALPGPKRVEVSLHDVLGRRMRTVVNGEKEGRQSVQLDVSDLPSGVYFLRLKTEDSMDTRRLSVVR